MRALREAITNAVMHRDWFIEGANVFVEIYDDRVEVVSPGSLPKGMTLADLGAKSVRRNALIADLLHRIRFIEKAGTGIKRIRDEAHDGGYPEPVWEANGFVTTIFRPSPEVRAAAEAQSVGKHPASTPQVARQVPSKYPASTPQVLAVLRGATGEGASREALQAAAGIKDREHFRKAYLRELVSGGLLELTIPDKPRSSRQRYRLTARGRRMLASGLANGRRKV
jgi:ATP-dependent DNA helicase RecG